MSVLNSFKIHFWGQNIRAVVKTGAIAPIDSGKEVVSTNLSGLNDYISNHGLKFLLTMLCCVHTEIWSRSEFKHLNFIIPCNFSSLNNV